MRRPLAAAVAATALAAAAAGCGFGPGQAGEGEATIRVTRDYGTELVDEGAVSDPASSETVLRLLDREAEITTRYGGGFVQSIDGINGAVESGRSLDWFFYVNGVESSTGAAEVSLRGGDRTWWDYRDWTDAMRVPAVVGSWPQPFAGAATGTDRRPVRVECAAPRPSCEDVVRRLSSEGVAAGVADLSPPTDARGAEAPRLLVGPWRELRRDPVADVLDDGPGTSGVFARFERGAGRSWRLALLDQGASPVEQLGSGAGLVAAVREGEGPPTWIVAGTDDDGVEAAAGLLDASSLRDHYAVAAADGEELAAPVVGVAP